MDTDAHTNEPRRPPGGDTAGRLAAWADEHACGLVWSGWALLSLFAGLFVWHFGLPVPFADEWWMIDVVTGQSSPSLAWLWDAHNTHRMPLPKFSYLVAGALCDYRFERMALANVGVLSAIAAVAVVAARRMRGRSSPIDLVYPAAVLHFGHQINLTWSFQLNNTLATALAIGVLLAVAATRAEITVRRALAVGALLVLLAACGTFGLFYVPALVLWLGLGAAVQWRRDGAGRMRAAATAAIAIGLLAMVCGYAACFPPVTEALRSRGPVDTLQGAAYFMTTSLGPVGRAGQPLTCVLILALAAGAGLLLRRAWSSRPDERLAIAGLALFLTSTVLLAVGVSYGRAGNGVADLFQTRYGMLSLPLLACVLLVWDRFTSPLVHRRFAVALLILVPLSLAVNDRKGWRDGQQRLSGMRDVIQSAREGVPAATISTEFYGLLQCPPRELERHLGDLQARGLGPYRQAQAPARKRAAVAR